MTKCKKDETYAQAATYGSEIWIARRLCGLGATKASAGIAGAFLLLDFQAQKNRRTAGCVNQIDGPGFG